MAKRRVRRRAAVKKPKPKVTVIETRSRVTKKQFGHLGDAVVLPIIGAVTIGKLLLGAGAVAALAVGKKASAGGAGAGAGAGAGGGNAGGGGGKGVDVDALAQKADGVFATLVGVVGGVVAVAPPSNAPYVGAAAAAVTAIWASTSKTDKANIVTGGK